MQFTYYAAFNYGSAVVIYNNKPSIIHRKVPGIIKILPTPPNITFLLNFINYSIKKWLYYTLGKKSFFSALRDFYYHGYPHHSVSIPNRDLLAQF